MKSNKVKFLSGIFALLISGSAIAQTTPSSSSTDKMVSFQIRAGVNFQNLNGEIEGEDADGDLLTAFHAGVEVPINIAPEFYIQPGVIYSMKGTKNKDADSKIKLSYIEIPVNFVYKPMLGMGNLILGVGPYVAFGIGGKVKNEDGDDIDIEFENDITLAQAESETPYFKRMDFGGNLIAGYQFSNRLFFQLNAQLGMTNIFPKIDGDSNDDWKLKNTGFGISVGYGF